MRRGFVAIAALAVVASLSWMALPVGEDAYHAAEGFLSPALGGFEPAHAGSVRAAPIDSAAALGAPATASPSPAGSAVASPTLDVQQQLALPEDDTYIWPMSDAKITTYYAPQAGATMLLNGVPVHNGIDMARPCGWPVAAAHDGTVLAAGRRTEAFLGFSGSVQPYFDELARRKLTDRALPIMVIVDDGNGLISVYVHLAKASVAAGAHVVAGQLIGLEGATGNATGCHLHYSIYVADGPWVDVAPLLVTKWHYPAFMRLRIDPLLYLPADSPDAGFPAPGLEPPADPPHWVAPTPFPESTPALQPTLVAQPTPVPGATPTPTAGAE
jgi:murein DD-endopeptidase MepM/ murein hydrolase activator NlpD